MTLNLLILSMNASGHANPQLPLATELVQRGHNVTFVCGQPFQKAVEKTGAIWIDGLPLLEHAPNMNDNDPDKFKLVTSKLLEAGKALIETYQNELQEQEFDAVLYGTFIIAGPIIGALHHIPAIQLWPTFTPEPGTIAPIVTMVNQPPEVLWKEIDDFFAEYSIKPYHPTETFGEHNISFVPRFFQPAPEKYPDNFHFIGPTMGKRTDDHLWSAPEDTRPLVFISLGTIFNQKPEFFAQCMEALGDEKYQVFMAIGEKITTEDLPEIPDNFTVAASFPQPKLLQSADIFLSHAGMNSCMEGIYNEVPFVLLPQMDEQESNANKLVELGLGKLLTSDCAADEIRAVIDEVYENPHYKENAKKYGSMVRAAGGAHRGADIIENIAQKHRARTLTV